MVEYAAPPLIGALIGYFTNYVAIKMLFKPVKPYYLFGRKLPFTPGLIPAKREKLAQAIARVVKENLLTEETIRKRLNHRKVRENLLVFTENFLEEFSRKSSTYIGELLEKVEDKRLEEVVPTELLKDKSKELIDGIFERLNGKSLRELLPQTVEREIERAINEKIDQIIESLVEQVRSGKPNEVIYTAVRENLNKLQAVIPFITEGVAQSLAKRATLLIEEMIERVADEPSFRLKLSKLLWEKFQVLLSKKIEAQSPIALKVKELMKRALQEYLEKSGKRRVGEIQTLKRVILREFPPLLSSFVSDHKREIAQILAERLLEIIERELPVILEAIDVEELVKERVNSLPIEEVEDIVLKLIDEELRHITLLGGALGFLIGLTQLIFT